MRSQLVRHGTGSVRLVPWKAPYAEPGCQREMAGIGAGNRLALKIEGARHRTHFGGLLCIRHGLAVHLIHRLARSFHVTDPALLPGTM